MDIKQEDLIRFWTWCGFKENPDKSKLWNYDGKFKETNHWWIAPTGKNYVDLPQPTLDNLYQYSIPKLQDKGYFVALIAYEHKGFKVNISHITNENAQFSIESDSPTEALCNAIMKVVNNVQ